MAASLADLEGWLSKITENTRLTYEAVVATRPVPQGGAGGSGAQFGTSPNFAADLDAARKGGSGNPRAGGSGHVGSAGAGMSAEENWLIKIAEYTRLTHEALSGRTLASASGAGATRRESSRLEEFAEKLGKRIEGLAGHGIASGLGQAQSLRQRGMSGTLESARLDYATEQLGRQMAAVMLPLTQGAGYLMTGLERRMRGLSGDGQNALMGGIVGAGLGMRYGGVPGAVFGGIAGAAFMGAPGSTEGAVAGALSGAFIGGRTAGPYGAAAGALAGGWAGGGGMSDYAFARRSTAEGGLGSSRVGAAAWSMGDGIMVRTMRAMGVMSERPAPPASAPAPRRDVTPFSAEMVDAGASHFAMQAAVIRATAGPDFEDGGPLGPLMNMLLGMFDKLMVVLDPTYRPPPPPSMEGAR